MGSNTGSSEVGLSLLSTQPACKELVLFVVVPVLFLQLLLNIAVCVCCNRKRIKRYMDRKNPVVVKRLSSTSRSEYLGDRLAPVAGENASPMPFYIEPQLLSGRDDLSDRMALHPDSHHNYLHLSHPESLTDESFIGSRTSTFTSGTILSEYLTDRTVEGSYSSSQGRFNDDMNYAHNNIRSVHLKSLNEDYVDYPRNNLSTTNKDYPSDYYPRKSAVDHYNRSQEDEENIYLQPKPLDSEESYYNEQPVLADIYLKNTARNVSSLPPLRNTFYARYSYPHGQRFQEHQGLYATPSNASSYTNNIKAIAPRQRCMTEAEKPSYNRKRHADRIHENRLEVESIKSKNRITKKPVKNDSETKEETRSYKNRPTEQVKQYEKGTMQKASRSIGHNNKGYEEDIQLDEFEKDNTDNTLYEVMGVNLEYETIPFDAVAEEEFQREKKLKSLLFDLDKIISYQGDP